MEEILISVGPPSEEKGETDLKKMNVVVSTFFSSFTWAFLEEFWCGMVWLG